MSYPAHCTSPLLHGLTRWSVVSGQEVMMCFVRCGTCLRCSWSVPSLASITGSVHSLLQTTISMEAPTRPSRFLHIDLL